MLTTQKKAANGDAGILVMGVCPPKSMRFLTSKDYE